SNSVELRREVLAALALPDLRLVKTLPLDPDVTLHWLDPKFERLALCRGSGPVEIRATSDYRLLTTLSASTNLKAYVANWSPDGRFVAIKRDYDRRGYTNDVEVWTVDPPQRVLLIREAQYDARSYHPSQPKFVTTGRDGSLTTWDLERGKQVSRHQLEATGEL